jgi:hypothetical protein
MRINAGPRSQAMALLLLVATSGALAGVVGDRLISDRTAPAAAPEPTAGEEYPVAGGPWRLEARPAGRYAERLGAALELSPQQQAAIDEIVAEQQARVQELTAEVQPRFRAIAEHTRGRIEDVLTTEQRERLRTLRSERMRATGRPDGRWRDDSLRIGPGEDGRPGRRLRDGLRPGSDSDADSAVQERRDRTRERRMQRAPGDMLVPDTSITTSFPALHPH